MHTKKGLATLTVGLTLTYASLAFRDWQMLALALPFLFFLLFSGGLFLTFRPTLRMEKRLSASEIDEGSEVDVEVTVRAAGGPIGHVELIERLPERLVVSGGAPYFAGALGRGGVATHHFRVRAPLRGAYVVGPTVARIRSVGGLFYREVEATESPILQVTPRPFEIRALSLTTARPKMRVGAVRARQRGEGTDYQGIRRYTPADNPRRINWKASARSRQLLVNQYEMEDVADVTIFLDARTSGLAGTVENNPVDHGARAVASIAGVLLKGRNRVGFLAYGDPAKESWVYPDASRKQFYKILERLVEVEAQGDEGLDAIVARAMRFMLPSRSLVVVVSSILGDATFVDGLRALLARGHRAMVVSPSPVAIEAHLTREPGDRLALSLLGLERATLLSDIRALHVPVIDWDPGDHLALAMEGVYLSATR